MYSNVCEAEARWHSPIATQEVKAGGPLEPRKSRPAGKPEQNPISKGKKKK